MHPSTSSASLGPILILYQTWNRYAVIGNGQKDARLGSRGSDSSLSEMEGYISITPRQLIPSVSRRTLVLCSVPQGTSTDISQACLLPICRYYGAVSLKDDCRGTRFVPTCVGSTSPPLTCRCDRRGSSPHTWGPRHPHTGCSPRRRFIPTCVGSTYKTEFQRTNSPVHPHVRGDHRRDAKNRPLYPGSSPRAWGPPLLHAGPSPSRRFIPTCVGTTILDVERNGIPKVHPHVRGDHVTLPEGAGAMCGSSPRAWGPLLSYCLLPECGRFIPTCVGTTASPQGSPGTPAVHPHVRGDHGWRIFRCWAGPGSSPRAWGPLLPLPVHSEPSRFIPTCVGTTAFAVAAWADNSVHPHVRGDHEAGVLGSPARAGSSPRAWGPHRERNSTAQAARFIPTCVGTTTGRWGGIGLSSVHPHVRGDHPYSTLRSLARPGSSPRAWGPLRGLPGSGCGIRFIPTCVGTTRPEGQLGRRSAVHPHVRGDHANFPFSEGDKHGSSPRAWGPHGRGGFRRGIRRFIPTCVGTTL